MKALSWETLDHDDLQLMADSCLDSAKKPGMTPANVFFLRVMARLAVEEARRRTEATGAQRAVN